MPVEIPEGFGQVTAYFRHSALIREAAVVYGIQVAAATPLAACRSAFAAVAGNLMTRMDPEVTLDRVEGRIRPDGFTLPVASISDQNPVAGTGASVSPSPQVAVLLKKLTAVGGRHNRGRMYLPWWTGETDISETGAISPAALAADQAAANDFLDAQADGSGGTQSACPMVILHNNERVITTRTANSVTKTRVPFDPPVPAVVVQLVVEPLVATQRRRLRS